MERLQQQYRPDQLWYSDDVFSIHYGWLHEYAGELKRRNIKIPFECISRADRLDDEIVEVLAGMGCRRLWIGSESGSQRVLDAMHRDVSVEQVADRTRALKRRGIEAGMFIMLGYEGEQMKDLERTRDHLKETAPDIFLTTVAYPIKGTEYYDQVEDRVVTYGKWDQRTDRESGIRGRHSRRFYSFAARWLANSVALHELKNQGSWRDRIRAAFGAVAGRVGMLLTGHEQEA